MARVVLGSYMVRYPLGGMMSYVLQYLVGFTRLGHFELTRARRGATLAAQLEALEKGDD